MDGIQTVIHKGSVAVVTGAASGLGLAASKRIAGEGMSVVMVDVSDKLEAAAVEVRGVENVVDVLPIHCDVSDINQVVAMREKVLDAYGEVHILLNNAGIGRPRGTNVPAFSLTEDLATLQKDWAAIIGTNQNGIINVAQAFAPQMARQENACVIINTGSKQGITCPPGNAAYNVSKAAVKAYTEQLAYELRNVVDTNCTAHLFIPGWAHTGMNGAGDRPKPPGAWTAEQTVDYMFERVIKYSDFYVVCPDNETPAALDKARIQWAAGDIIENRPALSRWHPEFSARYDEFVSDRQGLAPRSRSRGRPLERIPDVPQ